MKPETQKSLDSLRQRQVLQTNLSKALSLTKYSSGAKGRTRMKSYDAIEYLCKLPFTKNEILIDEKAKSISFIIWFGDKKEVSITILHEQEYEKEMEFRTLLREARDLKLKADKIEFANKKGGEQKKEPEKDSKRRKELDKLIEQKGNEEIKNCSITLKQGKKEKSINNDIKSSLEELLPLLE